MLTKQIARSELELSILFPSLHSEQRMIIDCDQFELSKFVPVTKLNRESFCKHKYIQEHRGHFVLRTNMLICDEGLTNRLYPYREFIPDASLERILEGIQNKLRPRMPLFFDGILVPIAPSRNSIYGRFDISFLSYATGARRYSTVRYDIDVLLYWDIIREILLLFEVRDIAFLVISKLL